MKRNLTIYLLALTFLVGIPRASEAGWFRDVSDWVLCAGIKAWDWVTDDPQCGGCCEL